MRLTTALSLVALLTANALAQTPAAPLQIDAPKTTGTAVIRGRVIAASSGRPLALATVSIRSSSDYELHHIVMTDTFGRYEIRNLPGGRYSFGASRPGYLNLQFDQPAPLARSRLLELGEGEQLDGIDFALHRGGAVVGTIRDELGDPMPNVRVEVMRETYGYDGRRLVPHWNAGGPIVTDDEGRFRVYALLPGSYVVGAVVNPSEDDTTEGYARTYFPGTMNEAEAQLVRTGVGQDATADFSLIPARLAQVAGIVRDSQGRPASGAPIFLDAQRGTSIETIGMKGLDSDGSFRFEKVQPGRHLLRIRLLDERAIVPVDVTGDDISSVTITTSAGYAVSGRVVFEGARRPEIVNGMKIAAFAVDRSRVRLRDNARPENGRIDADSHFRVTGVSGLVHMSTIGAMPSGWFIKQVRLSGMDVTHAGIDVSRDIDGVEIVLTDRTTTISGTVTSARGVAVKDYLVAFFPVGDFLPTDRAGRHRTIRSDPDGNYRVRQLPQGNYLAAAVPVMSLPIGGEWDPAFLERVRPYAKSFTLNEGQSAVVNLQLIE